MMSIEKILSLPSVDSIGFYDDELESVKEVLVRKNVDMPTHRALSRAMAKNGQTFPIHIADGETAWHTYGTDKTCPQKYRGKLVMGNGHHRVKLAIELGWTEMQYSGDVRYTGDDWND
jgi:hypothetical protein